MVNRFNWCGFDAASKRREEVENICKMNGWKYLCMQPGKRYAIKCGSNVFYWTYDEVLKKGSVENEASSMDSLPVGSSNILVGGISNKVSLVRYSGSV
jgi:hypothetical protein